MNQLPEPVEPGQLRASDADRERIAAVLRQAVADGRLDLAELDDRLAQAYAARTYAELEPLTRDLPTTTTQPPDPNAPQSGRAVAVMSGFVRKGRWSVPRRFTCVAFWGGGEVDLRDAQLAHGAVRIRAYAVMGGIDIVVPENATVNVTGLGIMGDFNHGALGVGAPGAPTVEIGGFAFWGGVSVKRRPSREEAERRRVDRERRGLHNE